MLRPPRAASKGRHPHAPHRHHAEAQRPAAAAPGTNQVQPFWASFNRDDAKSFRVAFAGP